MPSVYDPLPRYDGDVTGSVYFAVTSISRTNSELELDRRVTELHGAWSENYWAWDGYHIQVDRLAGGETTSLGISYPGTQDLRDELASHGGLRRVEFICPDNPSELAFRRDYTHPAQFVGTYYLSSPWASCYGLPDNVSKVLSVLYGGENQWQVQYYRSADHESIQGVYQMDDGSFGSFSADTPGLSANVLTTEVFPPTPAPRPIVSMRLWVSRTYTTSSWSLVVPSSGSTIMFARPTGSLSGCHEVLRWTTDTSIQPHYRADFYDIPYTFRDPTAGTTATSTCNVNVVGPTAWVPGDDITPLFMVGTTKPADPDASHTQAIGFGYRIEVQDDTTGSWTTKQTGTVTDGFAWHTSGVATGNDRAFRVVVFGLDGLAQTTGDVYEFYFGPWTAENAGLADLALPAAISFDADTVPAASVEVEGTIDPEEPGEESIGVDLDGDGTADYRVEVEPIDPGAPAPPPGSGYKVKIVDKDGKTVAIGYLPAGADPNDPYTLRVDGRWLTVFFGGEVIVTYVIPQATYNLDPSTFWIGYVDPVTGATGTPIEGTTPGLGGFAYLLCTTFEERPAGRSGVWRYAPNLYSEAIWETADGELRSSRMPNQADLFGVATLAGGRTDVPLWVAKDGHTYSISTGLALRVWDAGLSRFLTPAP